MSDRDYLLQQLIFFSIPTYAILTLTSMAPMNIGIGLVALAWLIAFKYRKPLALDPDFDQLKKQYYYYTWILSIACCISLVASAYWPYAYSGHNPTPDWHAPQKLLHFLFPLLLCSVFTVPTEAYPLTRTRLTKKFEIIVKSWWFMLRPLTAIALVQFMTGIFNRQEIPTSPNFYHVTLLFGHHLSTASIMIFPAFTALAVATGVWVREKKIANYEWAVGICSLLILFLSFARAAWVTLPIGIALIGMNALRGIVLKAKHVIGGFLALGAIVFALVQSPIVQERIANNMGIQDRFNLWKANIDYFTHRPLTGIGFLKTAEMSEFYFKMIDPVYYDNYLHYRWGHAHNNFFEMLGGAGLLGLLAFIAWVAFSLQMAFQTSQKARTQKEHFMADVALGIGIALVLMHINGLTQVNFWEGKVFHQQMLAIGFLFMIRSILSLKKS